MGVNYRSSPDWAAEVRTRAGRPADHVLEVTDQLDVSLQVAASNGNVTVFGTSFGTDGLRADHIGNIVIANPLPQC